MGLILGALSKLPAASSLCTRTNHFVLLKSSHDVLLACKELSSFWGPAGKSSFYYRQSQSLKP